ncbi:hypothetical protein E2C01_007424 [Portunus trituberculatus]|uniref:Uncharacterized protein n=1 Tax=Portunus trituberculatus TaxID=210409 RepID=A0A5B7D484_PORTR|nr:hypothetical protein [Portunus trituberculatus]
MSSLLGRSWSWSVLPAHSNQYHTKLPFDCCLEEVVEVSAGQMLSLGGLGALVVTYPLCVLESPYKQLHQSRNGPRFPKRSMVG